MYLRTTPSLLHPLKVEYRMDDDSSDTADEAPGPTVFEALREEKDTPKDLPKSRALSLRAEKAAPASSKVGRSGHVEPQVDPVAKPDLHLHAPPPPKRGDWWLSRTNRSSNGCPCGVKIEPYECRLIYCAYRPELALKAPSYARMHGKIDWKYHHVNYKCLPPPGATVQEVTGQDSIFVEIGELPKRFDESAEVLSATTKSATRNALQQLRLAGHNVELRE